jgi:predicted transcriptional regulator
LRLEQKSADESAQDVVSQAFATRHKFVTAVQKGLASAERGEFVESAEVWARIEKLLQRCKR